MELKKIWYEAKVELIFTKEEAEFLVKQAKSHYDSGCQAAGMSCADGAPTNGFIVQIVLFEFASVTWTFRQLDLVAKVLEPWRTTSNDQLRDVLFANVLSIMDTLSASCAELNKDS